GYPAGRGKPKASSPSARQCSDRPPVRCLLHDIDPSKLTSLLCGHPAGRGTALLLQAVRQQVTIAASSDYSKTALEWIISNDVLLLKSKKQSIFVRVLQADVVDSREQMARLINALASFTKGREYLLGKAFLDCYLLRGRRLPASTQEQLIATLQKASVRQSCQRELLQCGMLEWVVNFLENRTTLYATEYACSLAINLSLNVSPHTVATFSELKNSRKYVESWINKVLDRILGPFFKISIN
ncbi:unnamed protein product, partial [Heligmosomoides polygyrus]|uniref:RICTOR_M domain-containing protein n=1 Tax=Heligmosomoides polygyrus TaxID=6339 RepID=A0A183FK62_HELPZ